MVALLPAVVTQRRPQGLADSCWDLQTATRTRRQPQDTRRQLEDIANGREDLADGLADLADGYMDSQMGRQSSQKAGGTCRQVGGPRRCRTDMSLEGVEAGFGAKVRSLWLKLKILDGLRWISAVFPPKTLNYASLSGF